MFGGVGKNENNSSQWNVIPWEDVNIDAPIENSCESFDNVAALQSNQSSNAEKDAENFDYTSMFTSFLQGDEKFLTSESSAYTHQPEQDPPESNLTIPPRSYPSLTDPIQKLLAMHPMEEQYLFLQTADQQISKPEEASTSNPNMPRLQPWQQKLSTPTLGFSSSPAHQVSTFSLNPKTASPPTIPAKRYPHSPAHSTRTSHSTSSSLLQSVPAILQQLPQQYLGAQNQASSSQNQDQLIQHLFVQHPKPVWRFSTDTDVKSTNRKQLPFEDSELMDGDEITGTLRNYTQCLACLDPYHDDYYNFWWRSTNGHPVSPLPILHIPSDSCGSVFRHVPSVIRGPRHTVNVHPVRDGRLRSALSINYRTEEGVMTILKMKDIQVAHPCLEIDPSNQQSFTEEHLSNKVMECLGLRTGIPAPAGDDKDDDDDDDVVVFTAFSQRWKDICANRKGIILIQRSLEYLSPSFAIGVLDGWLSHYDTVYECLSKLGDSEKCKHLALLSKNSVIAISRFSDADVTCILEKIVTRYDCQHILHCLKDKHVMHVLTCILTRGAQYAAAKQSSKSTWLTVFSEFFGLLHYNIVSLADHYLSTDPKSAADFFQALFVAANSEEREFLKEEFYKAEGSR